MKDLVYKKLSTYTKKKFDDESGVFEIGIDSLDFVEIISDLETELNIEVSDEELMSIKKISDIISIIESKKK
ncbi:acyl carrier protein [Mycoplasma procyoni]|uniref:acyl carrier protein n=1 Tax=Mycoplasma procyoni TaxID=568784 RepID=UPI00197B9DA1|nr:acyl carrier protein [Mycoplasma procyoni]MBN3535077.1 acyl carrier protein [Mycoplasma procyoni]